MLAVAREDGSVGMEAAAVWLKVVHISALVFWCAGLFYLPGLFAAHARPLHRWDFHRLRAQSRTAYIGVASPAAIIAIASGTALIFVRGIEEGWLPLKLTLVALLTAVHLLDGWLLARHAERSVHHHPAILGLMVFAPALLIAGILWLVLAKPL